MTNYFKGINDCLCGIGMIFKRGVRRYVLVPLIINIALFAGAVYLLVKQIDTWIDRLIDSLLPDFLSWVEWLIWPLVFILVLFLVFHTFTLVANLIAAPFNSLLSARVEKIMTGSPPVDTAGESFLKTTLRTIGDELRKTLYFITWAIPLLILFIIPAVNIIAPLAWLLFAAWSFGLEYTDSPLGNRGLRFKEIKAYNRKHRMRVMGLGTGVFIMTSIPFLNFFAMPVGVCAATRLTLETSPANHDEEIQII